jgi:pyruvate/2-oxoglutarate dehydrogenase complex dihydrolipoamide acyltransferase (E2) component
VTAAPVRVPQVDVNDVEMVLLDWRVEHGARASKGQVLCVLETAKATHELESEAGGLVHRIAAAGSTVRVGEVIAWVGATLAEIQTEIAAQRSSPSSTDSQSAPRDEAGPRATPRARELALEHGLDLEQIPHQGELIKERDVRDFLAARGAAPASSAAHQQPDTPLPAQIAQLVEDQGELPRHKAAVARHLAATQAEIIYATIEVDVSLDRALLRLEEGGSGASLFHLVLHQTARALRDFPLLRSFRRGQRVWRWKETALAFTLVDVERDHRLVTPVVHRADTLSLEDLAAECLELSLAAYRGELAAEKLSGGAFTVSMLTGLEVTRFTALQNQFQSAVLAVGSPRERVVREDFGDFAVERFLTLTLAYDHGLCDGYYSGSFLARLKQALEDPDSAFP